MNFDANDWSDGSLHLTSSGLVVSPSRLLLVLLCCCSCVSPAAVLLHRALMPPLCSCAHCALDTVGRTQRSLLLRAEQLGSVGSVLTNDPLCNVITEQHIRFAHERTSDTQLPSTVAPAAVADSFERTFPERRLLFAHTR